MTMITTRVAFFGTRRRAARTWEDAPAAQEDAPAADLAGGLAQALGGGGGHHHRRGGAAPGRCRAGAVPRRDVPPFSRRMPMR